MTSQVIPERQARPSLAIEERAKAKAAKDWATSDSIRDHLKALGIVVKDTKDGAEWTLE